MGSYEKTLGVTVTFNRLTPTVPIATAYDVNLVQNPGFEDRIFVRGLPTFVGRWQGDSARETGGADAIARSGRSALQFVATNATGPSTAGLASQQWQLIDLSSIAADVDSGKVRVQAQAWFYRAGGDDDRFDIRVGAFAGVPSEFPVSFGATSGVRLADETSSVTVPIGGWTSAQRTFVAPKGTRYLALEIYAFENVANDATFPEFGGHYADDVSLVLRRLP